MSGYLLNVLNRLIIPANHTSWVFDKFIHNTAKFSQMTFATTPLFVLLYTFNGISIVRQLAVGRQSGSDSGVWRRPEGIPKVSADGNAIKIPLHCFSDVSVSVRRSAEPDDSLGENTSLFNRAKLGYVCKTIWRQRRNFLSGRETD